MSQLAPKVQNARLVAEKRFRRMLGGLSVVYPSPCFPPFACPFRVLRFNNLDVLEQLAYTHFKTCRRGAAGARRITPVYPGESFYFRQPVIIIFLPLLGLLPAST